MVYMITIILSILVTLNFILLKFSCNKTTRKRKFNKPYVINRSTSKITTQSPPSQLAATGS